MIFPCLLSFYSCQECSVATPRPQASETRNPCNEQKKRRRLGNGGGRIGSPEIIENKCTIACRLRKYDFFDVFCFRTYSKKRPSLGSDGGRTHKSVNTVESLHQKRTHRISACGIDRDRLPQISEDNRFGVRGYPRITHRRTPVEGQEISPAVRGKHAEITPLIQDCASIYCSWPRERNA